MSTSLRLMAIFGVVLLISFVGMIGICIADIWIDGYEIEFSKAYMTGAVVFVSSLLLCILFAHLDHTEHP